MSNFFEEYKKDGEKNISYHHLFEGLGIILITTHPILFAIDSADLGIFLPKFDSWIIFWSWQVDLR